MNWLKNREEYYDKEVFDRYPYIVAHEYKRLLDLLDMNQIYGACLQIRDVYEVLLKFPILLVLANIYEKEDKENELILEMFLKPLSMGDWVEKANKIIKNKLCNDAEIYDVLFDIRNSINNNQIVKWRNDYIGHGALALENNKSFKKVIQNHLETIRNHIIKLKSIYPNIRLYINGKGDVDNYLIGDRKAKELNLNNDSDIYIMTSENDYRIYPFIEIIRNEIYFFDGFFSKNGKTVLLNYINGDKLSIRNDELINIYNTYKNTDKINKLISNIDDDIYLESELDILNQMEKLNGFESPQYINDWIKSILEAESEKKGLILLQTERGMGKSAFVSSVDQLSLNKQKIFDRYEICIRAYYINDTYGSSVDNFEREVNEIFTYDVGKCDKVKSVKVFEINCKNDLACLLNKYRSIQERYYNKDRVLFIIDGIDENIINYEKNILDLIPEENMLDNGIFILLTCRTNEEIKDNKVLIDKLLKLKFIDTRSFYRHNNDKYNKILKEYVRKQIKNKVITDENDLNRILKYSDFRFLYLKAICQVIDSKNGNLDLCNIDSNDFINSFLELLKLQYSEKFFSKVINVFITIAIFYNPIGIKDICRILDENSASFEMIPILYDLKGFLVAERSRDGNVYSVTNEEIKAVIINKFRDNINSLIKNCINNMLETDFNSKYNEKSIEVIFFKNIRYYMRIANIDEDKYINIVFIEKVFKLIRNFELDSNNYKAIETFIELSSEIISLIMILGDKFNKFNEENSEEKLVINNNVLIDIYLLRAMGYSYINKQNLALKDFIVAKDILIGSIKLDEKQERQLAICYSEMGKIYRYIDINESIESYDKAIEIYYELSNCNEEYRDNYLGNILNKANTYLRKEPNEALKLYDLFINEYKSHVDNDEKYEKLSFAYGGKARAYRRISNCEKALENIQASLDYYNKINDDIRDEYLLVKLHVNRNSIYLKFYNKNATYLNNIIKDSIESISILNRLIGSDKIIENNILLNTFFNKALALFYKNELSESLEVLIFVEKLIMESLEKDEYVNYDIILHTYKYLIILNKSQALNYYKSLIQLFDMVKEMDNESVNMILEELYYILLGLIEKKQFKIITQLSDLTEDFIECNIERKKSNKICEDVVAIYTLIAIAYDKENDIDNFQRISSLAVKDNLYLYAILFNEYS